MKLFILVLAISFFGCSKNENSKETISSFETGQADDLLNSNIKEPIILDSATSLRLFKNFAEAYIPLNNKISYPPEVNDSLKAAIKTVKVKNKKEFEIYLSLIFIKLYRSNLRSSKQSFDFRKNSDSLDRFADPLIYEFNEMAGFFPKGKRIEFFSSGLAENWVESNPDLLKNKDIKREMKIIQIINDSIEKKLYWK